MKKILRLLAVIGILVAYILMAIPAHATAAPDSAPSISNAHVYHNLLETGDYFLIFEANVPYATPPSTTFPNTYVWRLIDTDGTTMLGSTTGYSYVNSGYGYNVYGMYFSAADVTAKGMIWNTLYTIRLSGNPTVFTTPPVYSFPMALDYYTSYTSQTDNQTELAATILLIAADVSDKWGLTTTALTTQTEAGTKLSVYGQQVFRNSIYGVQALAPTAFPENITSITTPNRSWNATYVNTLENQYSGTWVDTARNASIAIFGKGWDIGGLIWLLILCVILFIANISITNDVWNAFVDVAFILVIATRMGFFNLSMLAMMAVLSVIFIGMLIWRKVPGV